MRQNKNRQLFGHQSGVATKSLKLFPQVVIGSVAELFCCLTTKNLLNFILNLRDTSMLLLLPPTRLSAPPPLLTMLLFHSFFSFKVQLADHKCPHAATDAALNKTKTTQKATHFHLFAFDRQEQFLECKIHCWQMDAHWLSGTGGRVWWGKRRRWRGGQGGGGTGRRKRWRTRRRRSRRKKMRISRSVLDLWPHFLLLCNRLVGALLPVSLSF